MLASSCRAESLVAGVCRIRCFLEVDRCRINDLPHFKLYGNFLSGFCCGGELVCLEGACFLILRAIGRVGGGTPPFHKKSADLSGPRLVSGLCRPGSNLGEVKPS